MEFNEKQKIAIGMLNDFLKSKDKKFYLFGHAGTGKTFTVSNFLVNSLKEGTVNKLFICAPTHKALNVISSYFKSFICDYPELADKTSDDIMYMTFQKLLSYKPIVDGTTGKKVFMAAKESKFLKDLKNKLIVVDECSMISQDLLKDIDKYLAQTNTLKIIYLGDSAQLPPVEEDISDIFNETNQTKQCIILDEVMRTDKKEIFAVYNEVREWDMKNNLAKNLVNYHGTDKAFRMYHHKDDFIKTTWFKTYLKDLDAGKVPIILAWRNETVNQYNIIIRQHLYKKENIHETIVGDILVFNNFYFCSEEIKFYTSDTARVVKTKTKKKTLFDWMTLYIESDTDIDKSYNKFLKKLSKVPLEFDVEFLTVEKISSGTQNHGQEGVKGTIRVVSKKDQNLYKNSLNILETHLDQFFKIYKSDTHSTELWTAFYSSIVDPYADVIYGYSMTTHKSQSSTFSNVYVDMRDILTNIDLREAKCCLYTAATRASNNLAMII